MPEGLTTFMMSRTVSRGIRSQGVMEVSAASSPVQNQTLFSVLKMTQTAANKVREGTERAGGAGGIRPAAAGLL